MATVGMPARVRAPQAECTSVAWMMQDPRSRRCVFIIRRECIHGCTAQRRESAASKGRDRKNRSACPSMKGHGNPFSVTVDELVDAHFPPIMAWRRRNDSHFLRALCTKQHPGVSKDCPGPACDAAWTW